MNELLGWYGYEKVDSRDTQGLNLQHFTGATSPSSTPDGSGSEDVGQDSASAQGASRPPTAEPCTSGRGPSPNHEGSSATSDAVAIQHQQMVSALSMLPKPPDSPNLPPGCIVCAWCQKVGMKLFTLKTTNGCKAFCSELCFTQCRRASFKKNKVCDWCKHVRHTVNYVDFQDGEQQLQFCSDKCLNQYKMHIFCKETQAHLQLHTHLKEATCKMSGNSSVNLITPELWLRDCKSHSNGHTHPSNDNSDGRAEESSLSSDKSTSAPTVSTPGTHEDKETNVIKHSSRISKERDKLRRLSRFSSRFHSRKESAEPVVHTSHHGSRPVVNNTTPSSQNSTSQNRLLNGPSPTLSSSSPVGASPRMQQPPMHSPLGVGMEPLQPPFIPPGLYPPPLHMMAQQQMEAFFRAQQGMGMRPNIPPVPFPPWLMPPIPPPPLPPPPVSVPNSIPDPHPPPPPPQPSSLPPHQPSLIPPVTVVVPYPVVLPLPFPLPIPIPIPMNLLEKYGNHNKRQDITNSGRIGGASNSETADTSDSDLETRREYRARSSPRKSESVISKLSNSQIDRCIPQTVRETSVHQSVNNVSFDTDQEKPCVTNFQRDMDIRVADMDSRSYSPLSETVSTDDNTVDDPVVDDSDFERDPTSFTHYSHKPLSSSLTNYRKMWSMNRDSVLRSPSPNFATSSEKRGAEGQSSLHVINKRKCIRGKTSSL